ncbi:MAG: HisA/HisF-related TIM barrel protein, partial [Aestuariivirgaceae bacterium]
MIVYPDVELQNGRCVNLVRGQMDVPVVYDVDPVDAACDFAAQGAEWLHVVDLDAVVDQGSNADLITRIIRKAGASVQVAGGIRSIDTVRDWIDAGAGRVVIATAAVKDPAFVKAAAVAYPDQVVVGVDARQG